jgi:hypothetical protein
VGVLASKVFTFHVIAKEEPTRIPIPLVMASSFFLESERNCVKFEKQGSNL